MTLTIGRVGVPVASGGDGGSLAGPETFAQQAGQVTVSGHIYDEARTLSLWQARQLLGLLDLEENAVPVTFSDAPEHDGYYRVVDVNVDNRMVGSSTADAFLPWSVTLEQVANFRQPLIEVISTYGILVNGHSITTYDALAAFPGPTADAYPVFPPDTNGTRSVAEGSAVLYLADTGVSTATTSGQSTYTIPPASYYHGSCKIEHDIGSSTFRHAVGRPDFPSVGITGSDSKVLRLGNGLVRMVLTYSNATVSDLSIQWWDGSQWDTATEFYLEGVTTHGELTYHSVSVLHNRAEYAAIRLKALPGSFGSGSTYVDVSLRRGSRTLTFIPFSTVSPAGGWRVGFTTAAPSTTLTGGLRRTSNNAGGNRELLMSQSAHTKDLVNGRLTGTAPLPSAMFGIGCEVGGSGASGQNTQANQFDEWFCAFTEVAQVVGN